jgi:quinoprotein relay system zinc metallohydrolase 2
LPRSALCGILGTGSVNDPGWQTMTRNTVARLAAAAGWLIAAAGPACADFPIHQIAPGNYVHYGTHEERSPANLGDQANVGFIVGERCVAAIDAGGSLPVGKALRAAIRSVTDLPVCYVILTHVHPDHLLGAAAFLEDRPQFVGHAELPRALAARGRFYQKTLQRDLGDLAQGSEVVEPTLLVAQEKVIDLGNRPVRVRAWPVAHTDNDLTVYDDKTGTLWLSDLLFVDHTPVVDGSILGFLAVLGELRALPARQFVPGHGRTALPWPAALEPQVRYLEVIVRETRQALKNKQTIQEAVDTVGASEEKNWVNFEQFHRRNVTAAYTELEWE